MSAPVRWLCAVSASLAVLALVSWMVGRPDIGALLPWLPTMKVNTALCMLALSYGIGAQAVGDRSLPVRLVVVAALVVGMLSLLQSATGLDLGIDRWLIADRTTAAPHAPGRPAAASSLAIIALAVGTLLRAESRWRLVPALLAFALGYTATVGLLVEAPWQGRVGAAFATVSIPTAACVIMLSGALLGSMNWRATVLAKLAEGTQGARMLRAVLPLAMLVPAGLMWLQYLASRADWWGARGGLAVGGTLTAILFVVVAARTAHWIDGLQAELRDANDRLEARVTERTRELVAAQSGQARAEATVQARAEFLARVSHELRTPLNAILGFNQLIEMDPEHRLSAAQQAHLGHLGAAGRHLNTLVGDLLDFGNAEAGRVQLQRRDEAVVALVQEAVALMGPEAATAGIRIDAVAVEPGLAHVRAHIDRGRLLQVLVNLLSNAIKYNRPQGRVTVAVRREGDDVLLAVADTGEGLTPEQLAQLFVPFNRLGRERGEIPGSGIGLALAQRIVRQMDGRIEVRSEPGVGSEFAVRLRALPAAAETSPAAPGAAAPGRFRHGIALMPGLGFPGRGDGASIRAVRIQTARRHRWQR